jgi:hypothetical protein
MSPKDEALFQLEASEVRAGQRWKHTKNGDDYTIVATGIAEATLTPVVIYVGHDGVVWVRALRVFLENNAEGKPRFILITEEMVPPKRCCLASGFPPGDHALNCPSMSIDWKSGDGFEELPEVQL